MAAKQAKQRARLSDIAHDFYENYVKSTTISLKSKQQGYRYYSEGYFHDVSMFKDGEIIAISAKSYRSQRKSEKPHAIHLDIKGHDVSYAHCSCQAGASPTCSHLIGFMQALQNWQLMGFTEVPSQLSCTSMPQQWGVPRGPKIEPVCVTELNFVNPKPDRKRRPIQNTLTDCRKIKVKQQDIEHLQSLTNLPISYLTACPDKKIATYVGEVPIGSGLASHASFYERKEQCHVGTICGNLKLPLPTTPVSLNERYKVDELSIQSCFEIEEQTRQQADCTKWFDERKKRITASTFASVIKRKKVTEKFVETIVNPKTFTSAATSYGKCNEKTAINKYVAKSGNHIHDCGLVVNPKFPFLAATPDSKVCDNGNTGVLEVKCPYSARDMTIQEAVLLPKFCLTDVAGNISLRTDHDYYYQVQGQLMVSGTDFCDFVVYTRKGPIFIQRIFPDVMFMQTMLDDLCRFYFQHIKEKK